MFSTMEAQGIWHFILLLLFYGCNGAQSQSLLSYAATPRWGQATAILENTLLVFGGKTDTQHQFTYTSAPNTNDLLSLDLSLSFSVSSPPWAYISGSQNESAPQGPSVAFHTLTPFTTTQLLLFGGNSGFDFIQTNNDSAWLLTIKNTTDPVWTSQETGWAGEPMRRLYHTAPAAFGAVFIIGGLKGDQSQLGFPDAHLFNAVGDDGSPIFIPLTNGTNAPSGLFGHAAHILSNGKLIVFGGFFSKNAPMASPLSTIYLLDTTAADLSWTISNTLGENVPRARRDFTSVLLDDGRILIHGGGDATLQTIFQDGAILDTASNPMSWSSVDSLSDTLGPRIGHFSAAINGQVLFGLGWAGRGPANPALLCFDLKSNSFLSTFTAPTTSSTVTTLPISPTTPGGTPVSNPTDQNRPTKSSQNPSASTSPADPTSAHSKSSQTGTVIGAVIGSFAFVALVGTGVYYSLRRRERLAWMSIRSNGQRAGRGWKLMPSRDPFGSEDDTALPAIRFAGEGLRDGGKHSRGILGLSPFVGSGYRPPTHRRDMLADEDAYNFDVDSAFKHHEDDQRPKWRREGSMATSASSASYKSTSWNMLWNTSVSSLRNVGQAFTSKSRPDVLRNLNKGDYVNLEERLEKNNVSIADFTDSQNIPMDPQSNTYDAAKALNTYMDPFSDDNRVQGFKDENQLFRNDGDPTSHSDKTLPAIPEGFALDRIDTNSSVPSRTTGEQWNSSQESTAHSGGTLSNKSLGLGSYSSSLSSPNSHKHTSFIGSNISAIPVRRADTWWARLGRSTFRDKNTYDPLRRRKSEGVTFLPEFRDPNPPPRLVPIEETNMQLQDSRRRERQVSESGASTRSSVKTGHTADTALIEHLEENMEVVQRAISRNSKQTASTSTSVGSTSHGKFMSESSQENQEGSWTNETNSFIEPVIEAAPIRTSSPVSEIAEPIIDLVSDPAKSRPLRSASPLAARGAMYKQEISQSTRPGDGLHSSRTRHLAYGLAPKSSLFIANPEHPLPPS